MATAASGVPAARHSLRLQAALVLRLVETNKRVEVPHCVKTARLPCGDHPERPWAEQEQSLALLVILSGVSTLGFSLARVHPEDQAQCQLRCALCFDCHRRRAVP